MRFLLLLLIVLMIVAGLAWYTGRSSHVRAAPVPAGPGQVAWSGAAAGAVSGVLNIPRP